MKRTATRGAAAPQLLLFDQEAEQEASPVPTHEPEQDETIEPTSKHGWDVVYQEYQEALQVISRFPALKQALADGRTAAKEIRARDRVIQEQANTINLLRSKLEEARAGTEAEQLEHRANDLQKRLTAAYAENLRLKNQRPVQ